ncbi:MAG: diguanylate cyclase [Alphaproteobacteria bacterium]|nr:diguanylate cyclase [Alphaproteobacteria bacterium]
MSLSPASDLLFRAIDEHIGWLTAWHRLAFLDLAARSEAEQTLAPSPFFAQWRDSILKTLPQDQPAIERLAALHDQLHTVARLVLMKTPPGEPVARKDYDSVIAKYQELMQGLRRLERALSTAASGLDPLTGLRSRSGLPDDLSREHNRFSRTGRPFCVALMDLDHFKNINDSYGHETGDRVLAALANYVSRDLRSFDDAYRWGGEEFLLCLKEADLDKGLLVVERLRAGIEKKPIVLADGTTIPVTASFGVAASSLNAGPDDLLRAADKALYRAKKEGRNRVIAASTGV